MFMIFLKPQELWPSDLQSFLLCYRFYRIYRIFLQNIFTEYFSNQIEEDKDNPKKLWQHLKSIGLKGKQKEEGNICLNINGEICHEAKSVANHFNEFFTSIASTLVSKLPSCPNIFDTNSNIFKLFYSQNLKKDVSFVLTPVSEDFVFKELVKLELNL